MIVRKIFITFSVVLVSISLLAFTTFATSPELSDSTVTFSICGYYTQYSADVTYTQGSMIWPDGTISSAGSNNYKLSSSFSVVPGGTLFVYRTDASNPLHRLFGVCFYDSQGNVVPGGIDGSIEYYFLAVPSTAVSARVTIYRTGTVSAAASFSHPVAAPQSGVDSSNYQYLWSEIQGITIDEDGVINLPYQTNSYTWFMLDFKFFDSTYQFDTLAFTFYSTYTGGYFSGERLLEYEALTLLTYYTSDSGNTQYDVFGFDSTSSGRNPYRFENVITNSRFSGFRLICNIGAQVSTSIKVQLYDFELDGEGVALHLEARHAIADLDNLGNQLAIATPDTSAIYNNLNNVVVQLNDQNFGSFDWFGPSGGIYITMCVTTFTFAALAYILFGKRG